MEPGGANPVWAGRSAVARSSFWSRRRRAAAPAGDRKRASAFVLLRFTLARLSELKSALVSTVSQELRTPLTSIQNPLDIVRGGEAEPLAPDQERFLDMARRDQRRLAGSGDKLTNELLELLESVDLGGTRHERIENRGGGRRAGRAGEPALPAGSEPLAC